MVDKIIGELEAKIRAEPIEEAHRNELLKLLASLRTEVAELQENSARSLQAQTALKQSTEELRSSVAGFEATHPKLVQAVNSVSNALSNLGI
ncbi:MAG: DUF4404 family protein [Limisphaerales bacterium]